MKEFRYRLLLTILAILVLAQMLTPVAFADTTLAEGYDEYYCRTALSALPNSTALLYAYDAIVAGVESSSTEISVYDGVHPLAMSELDAVLDAYRRDHAEHFWFGNSYRISYNGSTILAVIPTYVMEGAALAAARLAFDAAIAEMLTAVDGTMSEFERERILHDRLAARVQYAESANAHNAYGALVEGIAVCEGYAEALQCLLHATGIQSLIAMGSSINPGTGTPEGHAWNVVRIDGNYYHTDLTWNDQDGFLFHAYFNLTDAAIAEDHSVTLSEFALPTCNSTAAQYFAVMGGSLSAYTVGEIATLLRENALAISVHVPGNVASYVAWLGENIRAIATAAGVTDSFSWSTMRLGHELYLQIDTCFHESLTYVPAEPVDCTTDGVVAHYACSCGKLFFDADAQNEIYDRESVHLYAPGHRWTEQIRDAAHRKESAEDCRAHDVYWYDCAACDAISDSQTFEGDAGPHKYGTAWQIGDATGHWHKCQYCEAHDTPVAHGDRTEVIPPSCEDEGYTRHTCDDCLRTYCDTYVQKSDHIYDGEDDAECNVCGATRTVTGSESSSVTSESTKVTSAPVTEERPSNTGTGTEESDWMDVLPTGIPPWAIPAAVVGGGLLLVILIAALAKKR